MDKLERVSSSKQLVKPGPGSLKEWEISLARELGKQLDLTASMLGMKLTDPAVTTEWTRELLKEPVESIRWAFEEWRRTQEFRPTIAGIRKLVSEWKRTEQERLDQEKAAEEKRQEAARIANGERTYGWTDPEVQARLREIVKAVEMKQYPPLSSERKNELKRRCAEFESKRVAPATAEVTE